MPGIGQEQTEFPQENLGSFKISIFSKFWIKKKFIYTGDNFSMKKKTIWN